MGFKTTGIDQMKIQLSRISHVKMIANEELRRCAEEVAETARLMAPIDYGDLRSAIQVGRRGVQGDGGRFIAGLSQYEVFINNNTPVEDFGKKESTVGEYAWKVHEHMGYGSRVTDYMPSAKSVAAGGGFEVGGKFLERAANHHATMTLTRVAQVVKRSMAAIAK